MFNGTVRYRYYLTFFTSLVASDLLERDRGQGEDQGCLRQNYEAVTMPYSIMNTSQIGTLPISVIHFKHKTRYSELDTSWVRILYEWQLNYCVIDLL